MSFAPGLRGFVLRHGRVLEPLVALLLLAITALVWVRAGKVAGVACTLVAIPGAFGFLAWVAWRRERFLREAPLPAYLQRKLREAHPHLSPKDTALVERGLRQFFLACSRSGDRSVAMPSKVVDSMWHEFILHTRSYREWCALGFGRFLHHTPAEVMGRSARRNDALRRAWFWACKDEAIQPRRPSRLPLLFALDAKLAIDGGFRYEANCADPDAANGSEAFPYCGTTFGVLSGPPGDAQYFGGSLPRQTDGDGGSGGEGGISFGDDGGCGSGCGGDGGGDGGSGGGD